MVATKKIEQVQELESYLKDNTIIIGTNYRGLNVEDMQGLRRALRAKDASYRVVKNRLLAIAANNIDTAIFDDELSPSQQKNLEQMFIKETLLLQKFLKKLDSNRQGKERLLVCQNKKISHV